MNPTPLRRVQRPAWGLARDRRAPLFFGLRHPIVLVPATPSFTGWLATARSIVAYAGASALLGLALTAVMSTILGIVNWASGLVSFR